MRQRILGLCYLLRAVISHLRPRSPEVTAHCLAATIDGQILFQSCCTKKGLLFVAYLMATTSPVFSRLHMASVSGNENCI